MIVRASELAAARQKLISIIHECKRDIIDLLDAGERNYPALYTALNDYVTFLRAADVLAGYNVLDKRDLAADADRDAAKVKCLKLPPR